MLATPILDMVMGGGSFGLSALIGFVTKGLNLSANKHSQLMGMMESIGGIPHTEEDKKRAHDLKMRELSVSEKRTKLTYDDLQNARAMQSRFVGITRRGLAWSTLFLLFMLGTMAIISVFKNLPAVSIPIADQHHILFGLISWTTHSVQQLGGLVWLPWFQTWFFMIGGFYFGREATK